MIASRQSASVQHAAVLLALLAAAAAYSGRAEPQGQTVNLTPPQTPAPSALNRNLVVLDPAHGGPDAGAVLGDRVFEKDTTLAMAMRLRAALSAAGFTVIMTRQTDSPNPQPPSVPPQAGPLTTDQRAEIANRAHAVACIVLHATSSGSGVHVYTSTLQPSDPDSNSNSDSNAESPSSFVPVPWDTAQASSVRQSMDLAGGLSSALASAKLPVLVGKAALRPLDNLMCPAVAIEIAPLANAGIGATPVTDADYQQRVSAALAAALETWRTHADPQPSAAAAQ